MRIASRVALGFVLLISSLILMAQDTTILFEFETDAVVRYGPRNEWDGRHTSAGAVVYHDGLFHMFRNGYPRWLAPTGIGYLTSEDGITWEEVQEDPVFTQDQIPFEVATTLLTAAIPEDDGTWTFYFGLFHRQAPRAPWGIVRATADSPTGTWTVDEEYVIMPGSEGAWDDHAITITSVLRTDEGYRMYYTADDGEAWAIGLATSEDGIHWAKYDDPETTELAYAESDPILIKDSDWEIHIQDPRVVQTPDGYVMLYSSFDGSFNNQGYNLAMSEDGIHWERLSDVPILPRETFPRNPWYPSLVYHDDIYYAYFEVDSRAGTDIFVATYKGSLID